MADPETFRVTLAGVDPVVLLVAGGEVDASTVGDLGEALETAARDHETHVVVDASEITFIDSTGISALVTGMRRLNRTRRRMALACEDSSALGRALEMTGLNHTFELHPTADDAVASLAGAPLLGR